MPSSVILGMGYEPESRVLMIAFRGGRGTYRYFDVPVEEWVAFRASGSKGTYLNGVFKARNYRYEKVVEVRSLRAADSKLVAKDQQRDANKDDHAEQQTKLLEWGETWALPKRA
jgi:hypothetical protein